MKTWEMLRELEEGRATKATSKSNVKLSAECYCDRLVIFTEHRYKQDFYNDHATIELRDDWKVKP